MGMTKSTGDEAAKRLGQGEIVEWCGQRLKLIEGVIHFETELTKVWVPSERFVKMSDVWSVAEGWMVEEVPSSITVFGKDVKVECCGSRHEWNANIGELIIGNVVRYGHRSPPGISATLRFFEDESYEHDPSFMYGTMFESIDAAVRWIEENTRRYLADAVKAAGGRIVWEAEEKC